MPLRFGVEVEGLEEAMEGLQDLDARLGAGLGPDGAGPAMAEELGGIQEERWETGGFGQWPKLTPSTIARRRAGLRSGSRVTTDPYWRTPDGSVREDWPIMVWTGSLRDSFTDPDDPSAALRMAPTLLHWGTRESHGNLLVAERNFTELRPEHEARLVDVFLRYVDMEEA